MLPSSSDGTDVVELCALFKCLGFNIRSLRTSDRNLSQDGGPPLTIVINCQGLRLVFESPGVVNPQNNGICQASGTAGENQPSKVLMAPNLDTLDPSLKRPDCPDVKVEFGLPEVERRAHIFRIHALSMNVEKDIRFDLMARLCPNSTAAEIRSVCTEAGMFTIRDHRNITTEKDFLEAVNKIIKSYAKFSATP